MLPSPPTRASAVTSPVRRDQDARPLTHRSLTQRTRSRFQPT